MSPSDLSVGAWIGESQRSLLSLLKRRGESSIADLEAGLELARETLRSHLKTLAVQGLVERSGVQRKGPGRPHVLYRLTPRGHALFPRREGQLLQELATFLLGDGHRELLERFFEARIQRKREALGQRVLGLEGKDRLEAVAQILSEEGFLAEVAASGSGSRLRLCHCPLWALASVSRIPCRAEMVLVEELLGETLRRESFMPEGAHSCTYSLERNDAPSRKAGVHDT